MKTMRKRNVDLNLKSDYFGKEKKVVCFRFGSFLLRWRNLVWVISLCEDWQSLELM